MSALSGRLVTPSWAGDCLATLPGAEPVPRPVVHALDAWAARVDAALGPASGARGVCDVAAVPLLRILGYDVVGREDDRGLCLLRLQGTPSATVTALVTGWGAPLQGTWRAAALRAAALDVRWVLCCNGASLRVIDGRRTWSRDFLEFDLRQLAADAQARAALWALVRADAMAASSPALDAAVAMSARHGLEVCRSLGGGVLRSLRLLVGAIRQDGTGAPALFEQSLTILYRVLFLLFAEARGLLPTWHPVYRDHYSVGSIVTALMATGRYRGIWHAVQAISRLAHRGLTTSGLRVTRFNGRLFAPGLVRDFERRPIPDPVMAEVVLAVGTSAVGRSGARIRVAYRDLDVEQLGAVYEQVLDHDAPRRASSARKATGTFYTPRALTAALVRQTLEPLVAGAGSERILSLRVLDPAMGSGAFLVGACRYLAAAAEDALVREGRWHPHDITAGDRTALRRAIASRCLYGVDLNPMAVQLARLSLWLVTLSAAKPLSFLDHHLIAGDSLAGATLADLRRQPSRSGRGGRHAATPLFDTGHAATALEHAARARHAMGAVPDDDVDAVRAKERALAALESRSGELGRWRRALDLWCAGWFTAGQPMDRAAFLALTDHVLNGRSSLPAAVAERLLTVAGEAAAARRFVHWELAFPEVFVDEQGAPRRAAGFDAIVGNPPWDMVRGDGGSSRDEARMLTTFAREAGIYRVDSRAHVNRYQLFVERALQLTRPGGRIGLVLPSGVIADVGAAPLRRLLFDRAGVDDVIGVDNREAIFPIHRSVRFVLLSATAGAVTTALRCRFGVTRPAELERDAEPVVLTRRFLASVSGEDDLGVPEIRSAQDLSIVERLSATLPPLASSRGWGAAFGRELNATDDRDAFRPADKGPGRLVVEGKHIDPFRVHLERCTHQVPASSPAAASVPRRERLAYRDVASAGNRLTIIAAIVPADAVTTHTLFCLRTAMPAGRQRALAALLNSFVANYLIRMRVNTHVTVGLMSRLAVPYLPPRHPEAERLARLAASLERRDRAVDELPEYAELQARAAHLYRVSREDFAHVLSTFPLVPSSTRDAAMKAFIGLTLPANHGGTETRRT